MTFTDAAVLMYVEDRTPEQDSCIQGPQEADLQCMFSIQLLYRKHCVQK